jgi:hypothetical protein
MINLQDLFQAPLTPEEIEQKKQRTKALGLMSLEAAELLVEITKAGEAEGWRRPDESKEDKFDITGWDAAKVRRLAFGLRNVLTFGSEILSSLEQESQKRIIEQVMMENNIPLSTFAH